MAFVDLNYFKGLETDHVGRTKGRKLLISVMGLPKVMC